ncbi:hypothetical protein [Sulfitobacter sp.]|uniref:hypothetical protein n=1 Tax=Sulfitobacter sp. TaxID=1903071 RepID=UPI003F6C839C
MPQQRQRQRRKQGHHVPTLWGLNRQNLPRRDQAIFFRPLYSFAEFIVVLIGLLLRFGRFLPSVFVRFQRLAGLFSSLLISLLIIWLTVFVLLVVAFASVFMAATFFLVIFDANNVRIKIAGGEMRAAQG